MNEIKLFENQQIRSAWDEEREEWLFSVVDVITVLTQSANILAQTLKADENG